MERSFSIIKQQEKPASNKKNLLPAKKNLLPTRKTCFQQKRPPEIPKAFFW